MKIVKYIINTAVLPLPVFPFPRNYREFGRHPRDITVKSVANTVEEPRLPRHYRDPHTRAVSLEAKRVEEMTVRLRVGSSKAR